MISFNQIPINVRTPGSYMEIDNTNAVKGLPGIPSRILLIGQRLASGTVAAGVATTVLSDKKAAEYFGQGSMAHRMVKAAKKANKYTELVCVALDDDGAAQAAMGSVTFGGMPTNSGTLNLYIGAQRVRTGVLYTNTAENIATAVVMAINLQPELLVTAAIDGADNKKVNLTARNKGEAGNDIDIRFNYHVVEITPTGLTTTIVAMNGGTANPDITPAITAMGDKWYTDIIMPYTDAANLVILEAELERRFGPMIQKDAHAYTAIVGSHAALTTFGNSRNSPHLSVMGTNGSPTPPCEWAAVLGAVCAYHMKIDPARPEQTLVLDGAMAPDDGVTFDNEERNFLLHDGNSTFTVDDGGLVRIERVITTYETNATGIDDISYLNLNTMKTIAYLRYSLNARVQLKYPRHKLANDGTKFKRGQKIVTPSILRDETVAIGEDWEGAGLIEDFDQFQRDLYMVRNDNDPDRCDAVIPPNVINQFRVFAAQMQFIL